MPFLFEKLEVYQKSLEFVENVVITIRDVKGEQALKDQLKRASLSIALNIAEGGGRFSKAEKKNFYVMARGSVYECTAIFQIMLRIRVIDHKRYKNFYKSCEEMSKMLNALITNLMDAK